MTLRREMLERRGVTDINNSHSVLTRENDLPKFTGRQYNPLEFLKLVEKRFCRNLNDGLIDWESVLEILSNAFVAETRSWFSVYRDSMTCLEEFKEKFLAKFWNENIQSRERQRIIFGQYRKQEGVSYTEYFLSHVLICKNLEGLESEGQILKLLLRHFPDKIREACCMQNISSIKQMECLLENFDAFESSRGEDRQNRRFVDRESHQYPNQRNYQNDRNRPNYDSQGNQNSFRQEGREQSNYNTFRNGGREGANQNRNTNEDNRNVRQGNNQEARQGPRTLN